MIIQHSEGQNIFEHDFNAFSVPGLNFKYVVAWTFNATNRSPQSKKWASIDSSFTGLY